MGELGTLIDWMNLEKLSRLEMLKFGGIREIGRFDKLEEVGGNVDKIEVLGKIGKEQTTNR